MIKIVDVNDVQLNKLKCFILEDKTKESTTHLFHYNGEKKVFKLFRDGINVDNKVAKMNLLNERLKNVDKIVTAETLIRHNGKIIGYTMPFIKGNLFTCLTFRKRKNILVLKEVSKTLKELHKLGIVCADIVLNTMVDENGNVHLIDYDNFAIDDLKVDTKNVILQKYEEIIENFDYHFDNYLLNLFTLNILTKISTRFLEYQYAENPDYFNFKDKEIRDIIEKTFNLKDVYKEDLIVDKIESKKDFKKIKRKIF